MLVPLRQAGERFWNNWLRAGRVRREELLARERALEVLELCDLADKAGELAGRLSGGQQKLLELARVLVAEPRLILLDEPAAGVNPVLLETLVDRIVRLNRRGVTFLVIEHNLDLVMAVCRPIVVMAQGKLIYHGDAAGVRAGSARARRVSRGRAGVSERQLEVQDLVAGYVRGLPVVHGVSLEVDRGEIVTLIGPNGAGKSTLLKAVAGLVAIEGGRVRLGGRDVTGLPAHEAVSAGIGFVPQTGNVFTTLTVHENLRVGAHVVRGSLQERLDARLRAVRAASRRGARLRARALSGGERQMLAIARALMTDPTLLMLDEPTAGLAPRMVERSVPPAARARGGGDRRADGGAEREGRARRVRPRLRAGRGPQPVRGAGARAAGRAAVAEAFLGSRRAGA